MIARWALLLLVAACSSGRADKSPPYVVFEGTCDASGAVPIDAHTFAVADDEDNVLRIYDADKGGAPIYAVDITDSLQLEAAKHPEADLEAATQLGSYALWISSHARTKKGKSQPDRLRFFATPMPKPNTELTLEGAPYSALLDDLLHEPRLERFRLAEAAERAPQEEGGLNLEGMTAMPSGAVLIGFRNPIPQGKALLVPLENPLEPMHGKPARFGDPVQLDLGGLGVRSLSYWHGQYLIAAGHYEHGAVSRLYAWRGDGSAPQVVPTPSLEHFNPEAFFTPEDRDRFMVLSDDGGREIDGKDCKKLKKDKDKRFRGLWLRLP